MGISHVRIIKTDQQDKMVSQCAVCFVVLLVVAVASVVGTDGNEPNQVTNRKEVQNEFACMDEGIFHCLKIWLLGEESTSRSTPAEVTDDQKSSDLKVEPRKFVIFCITHIYYKIFLLKFHLLFLKVMYLHYDNYLEKC